SITPSTSLIVILSRFLLTAPSPPHLSTLSLHDALPILMGHIRTRPSAIYLASCLQNLQTLNAPRNNSEAAVPLLSPAAVPPQSMALDVGAARNHLVQELRKAPKASAPADLQSYVGSPVPVLGLSMPTMRAILVAFAKDRRTLTAAEVNALAAALWADPLFEEKRSEERRVGKECGDGWGGGE